MTFYWICDECGFTASFERLNKLQLTSKQQYLYHFNQGRFRKSTLKDVLKMIDHFFKQKKKYESRGYRLRFKVPYRVYPFNGEIADSYVSGYDDFDVIRTYWIVCPRCLHVEDLDDWLEI